MCAERLCVQPRCSRNESSAICASQDSFALADAAIAHLASVKEVRTDTGRSFCLLAQRLPLCRKRHATASDLPT